MTIKKIALTVKEKGEGISSSWGNKKEAWVNIKVLFFGSSPN